MKPSMHVQIILNQVHLNLLSVMVYLCHLPPFCADIILEVKVFWQQQQQQQTIRHTNTYLFENRHYLCRSLCLIWSCYGTEKWLPRFVNMMYLKTKAGEVGRIFGRVPDIPALYSLKKLIQAVTFILKLSMQPNTHTYILKWGLGAGYSTAGTF